MSYPRSQWIAPTGYSTRGLIFGSLVALALLTGTLPAFAYAQFSDTFESTNPSWKLRDTDCIGPETTWHQQRKNDPATGNRFERIRFQTGLGTQILVSHDIPPSFVISELKPSVRIKATRPGIRLMVRVVLPNTPAPDGKGHMTTTLAGQSYQANGQWETLGFEELDSNLADLLQQELWILRRKYGSHVDGQNAYVDKLVLNLFTGAGKLEVNINDIKVNGIAAADAVVDEVATLNSLFAPLGPELPIRDDDVQPASFNGAVIEKQPSLVVRDGSVLEINGRPFFPRIIQRNREPFDFLKSLGFNTIELTSTATPEQLKEAQDLDLWLVCPAPSSAGLEPIGFEYDRVLAWSLGDRLEARSLQNVQQTVREIRSSDQREGRPLVAGPTSHWTNFGREVDVLAIGLEPLGTSFLASQYSSWLRMRSESLGGDKPIWATIQTEFAAALTKQITSVLQKMPPTPVEPQQLKFLTYEALAGGARGLRFASRNPLDLPDPETRLRAMTIKWMLTHIQQLEPWAVGGALMGELPLDNNHLEVTAFNTNRSRLLLIQRPTHHEQYWAGDRPLETIRFKDTAVSTTDRAYQIREHALEPIVSNRDPLGAEIQIDQCPYTTAVVLSQDSLVINKLNQGYQFVGQPSLLQLHYDITRQWLAVMQLIDNQMGHMSRSSSTASGALNEAINDFREATKLINTNQPGACLPFLDRTDERLAFARREMVTQPLGLFKSKTSTPFLTHCSLVPLHWQLTDRLNQATWNPNGLAGGDFENLPHMTRNGWENKRFADPMLISSVELSEAAAKDGKFGLKLTVKPVGTMPRLVQSAPVWVKSAMVPVRAGQLVRIHGWVNIPQVIMGTQDGLMIAESLGGNQLAERIPLTKGWQEFTLYRAAATDGEMEVTFALTGVGEAMINEVTIRTIDLPVTARQARSE